MNTSIAERAELLRQVELFAGLDRVTLSKLAARLEAVPVADGTILCRQGDPADGPYLICRGHFGIFVAPEPGFGEIRLSGCARGDVIGEMALLTNDGRAATVRAEGDGEVLHLHRTAFLEIVRRDPSVALAVAATLSRRLREANAARTRTPEASPLSNGGPPPDAAAASSPTARPATPPTGETPLGWRPSRALVGLALAALTLAIGWGTPPPAGLTPAGWHALATLVAIVPVLALEALPDGAVALALAAVLVLGGVAPAPIALSGLATGSLLLIVSVLAVGAAIASCGLLYRLALWAVVNARGGYSAQVTALGLAGLLVGAAVPHAVGRVSLIAPALPELVESLGHAPGSRPAAGLAMAVLAGFGQMVAPFLSSSSAALLAYALLPDAARAELDWGTWALRALPTHVVIFGGLLAMILWWYRPAATKSRPADVAARRIEMLALQRALLGPVSRQEWIAAIVAGLLVVGFATQSIHGVDPAWVGVAAFVALSATGVITADTLRAVNWSYVLLFGMLASTAAVFASSGLDRWLAGLVAGTATDLADTPMLFVAGLTLFCYGLSLVLRWAAAAPLLTLALGPVAGAVGIDPWVVAIVALTACNGFFLPYQSTIYLALYQGTGGRLFSHAQARPVAIAYGLLTLLALCASVPLWRAMGLL